MARKLSTGFAMAAFLLISVVAIGAAALAIFLLACVCDSASEMITGHRKPTVAHGFEVKLAAEEKPVAETKPSMKKDEP
jgi:hypothetical protein